MYGRGRCGTSNGLRSLKESLSWELRQEKDQSLGIWFCIYLNSEQIWEGVLEVHSDSSNVEQLYYWGLLFWHQESREMVK